MIFSKKPKLLVPPLVDDGSHSAHHLAASTSLSKGAPNSGHDDRCAREKEESTVIPLVFNRVDFHGEEGFRPR